MKKLSILGSTGSIGVNTLDIVSGHSGEFKIVGLAAGTNVNLLKAQIERFNPEIVSVLKQDDAFKLKEALGSRTRIKVLWGLDGYNEIASAQRAQMVVSAMVGAAGLVPTWTAIEAGKNIALANKETLVMAGRLITERAAEKAVRILPVDSEHSAIFQCLEGHKRAYVRRIVLTASGGPFLRLPEEAFRQITVEDALKHPKWKMGKKITVDSASMMNKGLEVIEARWLFGFDFDRIRVIIHPQSIVHSMVEFVDGSLIAQLSTPDMCLPIQYALTYPGRAASDRVQTNFPKLGTLTFEEPDTERFPSVLLARKAGETCGTMPAVFNAANEVAVEAFVNRRINFPQITETVRRTMDAHQVVGQPTLEQILEADAWARREAAK